MSNISIFLKNLVVSWYSSLYRYSLIIRDCRADFYVNKTIDPGHNQKNSYKLLHKTNNKMSRMDEADLSKYKSSGDLSDEDVKTFDELDNRYVKVKVKESLHGTIVGTNNLSS